MRYGRIAVEMRAKKKYRELTRVQFLFVDGHKRIAVIMGKRNDILQPNIYLADKVTGRKVNLIKRPTLEAILPCASAFELADKLRFPVAGEKRDLLNDRVSSASTWVTAQRFALKKLADSSVWETLRINVSSYRLGGF